MTRLISPGLTRYCVVLSLTRGFHRPWLGLRPHLCFDKRRGSSEVRTWAHGRLNNCTWNMMRSHCFVYLTMCSTIAELAHHLLVTTCAQTCRCDGTWTGGWTLPAGWSQWDELSPLGGSGHVGIMALSKKLHHLSIRHKITLPSAFYSRKPMTQSYSSWGPVTVKNLKWVKIWPISMRPHWPVIGSWLWIEDADSCIWSKQLTQTT